MAFVCAALLTLVVGFYVLERFRGRAAWNAYQAEARARGVKLDFADFVPPKVPDAENFASIPVFAAAFEASDKRQEIPNPFKLPSLQGRDLPKRSDPTKQAVIDLAGWQKYFVETKLLPAAGDAAATDVLQALDHFAAPLAQLHEAGARPRCSFPVHWEQKWGALLPHLQLLQDASKLYALRMSAHLASGESGAAYEDFRDSLRLTTAIREEPSFISGLVRIANTAVVLNAVWGGLAEHQWAEPELRRIETDLAALDWLKDYEIAMESERAAWNALFDLLINDPARAAEIARSGSSADGARTTEWILRFYPSGWNYQSSLRMNRYFDELLARLDPVQHRWFADRPTPSSPQNIRTMPTKIHYLFFAISAPLFEAVENKWVQAATVTDQARLACALERFRMAHESFPDALAELAPGFIPEVPAEIVNGEAYHYRRTDDGSFVLYSVGTDLRDDGGVIDPKLSASKQRDWVWRYPAK